VRVIVTQAAFEMIRFQLRHGNDLLAVDCLRKCDVRTSTEFTVSFLLLFMLCFIVILRSSLMVMSLSHIYTKLLFKTEYET